MIDLKQSILQTVDDELLSKANVKLFIKRDDLLDEEISGNKWRKLKNNAEACRQKGSRGVLTFGGAFSNHLVATAKACADAGLESVGVVRGDELNAQSNDTLRRCEAYGMKLVFVTREEYKLRNERYYQEALFLDKEIGSNMYIVPEGGANYLGMIGCQEIVSEIDVDFDKIILAQGTTTTSCGIGLGLREPQKMLVVPVLKGFDSITEMTILLSKSGFAQESIDQLLSQTEVWDQYHFGAYGKYNNDLLNFIRDFYLAHKVKLDPIYTGKTMYALYDQINKGNINDQTIVFVHTGGIQGAAEVIARSGFDLWKEG